MSDIFQLPFDSEAARYIGATLVGFLVASFVEWGADRRRNKRTVLVVRETLAEEIVANLEALDEILDALKENLGSNPSNRWPLERVETRLLEHVVDPVIGSLLSPPERLQAGIAVTQCNYLNEQLNGSREQIITGQLNAGYASVRIMDRILIPVGQTLTDLLCQILQRQQQFHSTKLNEMVLATRPLWEYSELSAPRIWRLRVLPNDELTNHAVYIVWYNDDPARSSLQTRVVELKVRANGGRFFDPNETSASHRILIRIGRRGVLRRLKSLRSRQTLISGSSSLRPLSPSEVYSSISEQIKQSNTN